MAELIWTSKIEIDCGEIDRDHKKLLLIFNTLLSCKGSLSNAEVSVVIDDLIGYTKSHFTREEQIQKTINYPGANEHSKQHNEIITKLGCVSNLIKNDADSTTLTIRGELLALIRAWLFDHIMLSDTKMRPFKDKINKASAGMNSITKYLAVT